MNIKKHIFLYSLLCLIAVFSICRPVNIAYAKPVSSYIVINAKDNKVIKGENIHARLPMASTTKIMTAYTVIKNFVDLDLKVKVDKLAVGIEGSSIYLQEGEELSIRELLYGLMLRSGNDSAVALAIATYGSVDNFVKQMNYEAKLLNLENTHFTNPHGLNNENHYTSAYDLAIITSEAYKYKDFVDIVSCKNITINGKEYPRCMKNKNKLLFNYDGANGVKTGFTKKAGRCLVGGAKKDGVQLISVVLNVPDMFEQTKYLLDYGFKHIK